MSIDSDDLARLRADADELLPDTATILDHSHTRTDGGGVTDTYTARAQTVACRVAPIMTNLPAERGNVGGRVDARSTHWITLPAGTVITDADRVQVGGVTYEITLIRTRSYELIRRLEAREVQ